MFPDLNVGTDGRDLSLACSVQDWLRKNAYEHETTGRNEQEINTESNSVSFRYAALCDGRNAGHLGRLSYSLLTF